MAEKQKIGRSYNLPLELVDMLTNHCEMTLMRPIEDVIGAAIYHFLTGMPGTEQLDANKRFTEWYRGSQAADMADAGQRIARQAQDAPPKRTRGAGRASGPKEAG